MFRRLSLGATALMHGAAAAAETLEIMIPPGAAQVRVSRRPANAFYLPVNRDLLAQLRGKESIARPYVECRSGAAVQGVENDATVVRVVVPASRGAGSCRNTSAGDCHRGGGVQPQPDPSEPFALGRLLRRQPRRYPHTGEYARIEYAGLPVNPGVALRRSVFQRYRRADNLCFGCGVYATA